MVKKGIYFQSFKKTMHFYWSSDMFVANLVEINQVVFSSALRSDILPLFPTVFYKILQTFLKKNSILCLDDP